MAEKFIKGQTKENAQRLLFLASEAGHEPAVVKATSGGFLVPEDVAEALSEAQAAEAAEAKAARTKAAEEKKAAAEAAETKAAEEKAAADEAEKAKTKAAATSARSTKKEE